MAVSVNYYHTNYIPVNILQYIIRGIIEQMKWLVGSHGMTINYSTVTRLAQQIKQTQNILRLTWKCIPIFVS